MCDNSGSSKIGTPCLFSIVQYNYEKRLVILRSDKVISILGSIVIISARRNFGDFVSYLFRAIVLLSSLFLVACGGQSSSSSDVVTGFSVTPGGGEVTLKWDMHPGQIYTVYYKAGPSVGIADYDNLLVPVTSPYVISNLSNDTQYSFILTATNEGSVAGPPSPVLSAVPGANGQGLAWTLGTTLGTPALFGITYGNNTYVAVGAVASVFSANSSNSNTGGVNNWFQTSVSSIGGTDLHSVIYDGQNFIALGLNGSVVTSASTQSWTAGANVNTGENMYSIAYGFGTYVAVGTKGAIATNNSAPPPIDPWTTAWTIQNSQTTQDLYGVAFVNGVFIAVGANGTLLTSSDGGVTWEPHVVNTTKSLWQVAFGVNTYVVVGGSGTILSSSDSATWQVESQPTSEDFYAVCYDPALSRFVAVGDKGIYAYSSTGASDTWTIGVAGTNAWYGITAGGPLVAVGDGDGTVANVMNSN